MIETAICFNFKIVTNILIDTIMCYTTLSKTKKSTNILNYPRSLRHFGDKNDELVKSFEELKSVIKKYVKSKQCSYLSIK
jgi:hypothetical protein